jgi:uncharacterized protein (DUF2267 family)
VSWDLRFPPLEPWSAESEEEDDDGGVGVLVVPGTFTVTMQKREDGVLADLGQSQSFEVVSIRNDPVLPGSTQEQRIIFESQVAELQRAAMGSVASIDAIVVELDAVKATLERSLTDGSLYEIANSIQQRLKAARDRLTSNESRAVYNDLDEMTVQARLWHAGFSPAANAHGPTPAQRESLRIANDLYRELATSLTALVDTDYAVLKEAMDTAKVPWTPGRGIQE